MQIKDVPERLQPRERHTNGRADTPRGEVAAVVLAGGASKRMGETNKLLAKIDGGSLVRRVTEAVVASRAAEVIVVTGHEAHHVHNALSGLDIRFVHNPHYPDGHSTSLHAGIGAVAEKYSGAVVLLGDMPRVTVNVVDALIERFHEKHDSVICQPNFGGRPGNPVLWPREFFPDILEISGDTGARHLLKRFADRVSGVEVAESGILLDIDTPGDLEALKSAGEV